MPYLRDYDRERLATENIPLTAGEMNYGFSKIASTYITQHGLSYRTVNDVIGALECAKIEFYRRVAAEYEDQKRKENGDVYS